MTGAGGFIGSHLVEKLVELGAQVKAFVRYNSRGDLGLLNEFSDGVRKEIEIVLGDLKDPFAVRRAVKGQSVVFHLGAVIAIPYSYIHPMDYVQTNVLGTLHVLDACREFGIGRMVHTSTSEVYGTAQQPLINEEHPQCAQSPYAASKIGADQLVLSYYRSYDLPVSIMRPFNTFGPRQSSRAVIPTIITQAIQSSEISMGEFDSIRDFCYVSDTVQGFLKMASSQESVGKTIQVGCGKGISIHELAKQILKIVQKDMPLVKDVQRIRPEKSEVMRLVCDNSLAKKVLGWSSSISLNEGLERTVEWIRSNLERYRVGEYSI